MGFGFLFFLILVFVIVRILGGPGAFGGGCCGGHYGQGHTPVPQGPQHTSAADPVEIARMRYARGEISQKEFEQIAATLRKD